MALSFTDSQIRELTGQVLNSGTKLKNIQNNANKIAKIKQDYQDLDNQEAVFTNSFHNIVSRFHNELKIINSVSRTTYDLANIDPSAKLAAGNQHFPDSWEEFKPLVIQSNNGLPENNIGNPNEIYNVGKINYWINKILNGFSTPSTGYSATFSAGSITFTGTGTHPSPSVGSELFITQAPNFLFGTVQSVNSITTGVPPAIPTTTTTIVVTTIDSVNEVSGAVSVFLGYSGFSQAVRISNSTDPFLTFCKQMIDKYSNDSKTNSTDENSELNSNDSNPDKSQIQNAISQNNQHISNINGWSSIAGQNRFNDTNLTNLTNFSNSRNTYLNGRVTEILNSLGNVAQDHDNITGSGRYLDLYNSISMRIHKTVGHLRNYYQQGLLAKNSNEMIYATQTQSNRDKELYTVKLLENDPDGTNTIYLKDISNLAVNDNIMIMENKYSTVLKCKIVSVQQPNKVELSDSVSSNYKLENQARLVKEKG